MHDNTDSTPMADDGVWGDDSTYDDDGVWGGDEADTDADSNPDTDRTPDHA